MSMFPSGKAWIGVAVIALVVLVIDWKTGQIRSLFSKIPAVGDFLTK